jgi:hypothetical protein
VQTSLQTKIMPNTDLFSKQKLIYLRLSNYGHNLIFVEKTSVTSTPMDRINFSGFQNANSSTIFLHLIIKFLLVTFTK